MKIDRHYITHNDLNIVSDNWKIKNNICNIYDSAQDILDKKNTLIQEINNEISSLQSQYETYMQQDDEEHANECLEQINTLQDKLENIDDYIYKNESIIDKDNLIIQTSLANNPNTYTKAAITNKSIKLEDWDNVNRKLKYLFSVNTDNNFISYDYRNDDNIEHRFEINIPDTTLFMRKSISGTGKRYFEINLSKDGENENQVYLEKDDNTYTYLKMYQSLIYSQSYKDNKLQNISISPRGFSMTSNYDTASLQIDMMQTNKPFIRLQNFSSSNASNLDLTTNYINLNTMPKNSNKKGYMTFDLDNNYLFNVYRENIVNNSKQQFNYQISESGATLSLYDVATSENIIHYNIDSSKIEIDNTSASIFINSNVFNVSNDNVSLQTNPGGITLNTISGTVGTNFEMHPGTFTLNSYTTSGNNTFYGKLISTQQYTRIVNNNTPISELIIANSAGNIANNDKVIISTYNQGINYLLHYNPGDTTNNYMSFDVGINNFKYYNKFGSNFKYINFQINPNNFIYEYKSGDYDINNIFIDDFANIQLHSNMFMVSQAYTYKSSYTDIARTIYASYMQNSYDKFYTTGIKKVYNNQNTQTEYNEYYFENGYSNFQYEHRTASNEGAAKITDILFQSNPGIGIWQLGTKTTMPQTTIQLNYGSIYFKGGINTTTSEFEFRMMAGADSGIYGGKTYNNGTLVTPVIKGFKIYDENNNLLSGPYLLLTGGTLTGNLYIQQANSEYKTSLTGNALEILQTSNNTQIGRTYLSTGNITLEQSNVIYQGNNITSYWNSIGKHGYSWSLDSEAIYIFPTGIELVSNGLQSSRSSSKKYGQINLNLSGLEIQKKDANGTITHNLKLDSGSHIAQVYLYVNDGKNKYIKLDVDGLYVGGTDAVCETLKLDTGGFNYTTKEAYSRKVTSYLTKDGFGIQYKNSTEIGEFIFKPASYGNGEVKLTISNTIDNATNTITIYNGHTSTTQTNFDDNDYVTKQWVTNNTSGGGISGDYVPLSGSLVKNGSFDYRIIADYIEEDDQVTDAYYNAGVKLKLDENNALGQASLYASVDNTAGIYFTVNKNPYYDTSAEYWPTEMNDTAPMVASLYQSTIFNYSDSNDNDNMSTGVGLQVGANGTGLYSMSGTGDCLVLHNDNNFLFANSDKIYFTQGDTLIRSDDIIISNGYRDEQIYADNQMFYANNHKLAIGYLNPDFDHGSFYDCYSFIVETTAIENGYAVPAYISFKNQEAEIELHITSQYDAIPPYSGEEYNNPGYVISVNTNNAHSGILFSTPIYTNKQVNDEYANNEFVPKSYVDALEQRIAALEQIINNQ